MIWKSMIGKLWATIIALVTVILLFLALLLMQFFETNTTRQVEEQMKEIASVTVRTLERTGDDAAARSTISNLVDVYDAGGALVSGNRFWSTHKKDGQPDLGQNFFMDDPILRQAVKEHQEVVRRGHFKEAGAEGGSGEMLIVGLPYRTESGEEGAVFVYQSLRVIQNMTEQSRNIIYIGVLIAIILTTFFAFFLSTRIGAPLRRMRSAALQVSQGNFDVNVPVITRDEVGELAIAFNKMRRELKISMTALKQEKEQLSGVMNNMADGVLMLDRQGHVVVANPPADRFLRSWNYEHDGAASPGQSAPEALSALFQEASESGNQQIKEISVQGRFWVVILTPLYDEQVIRGAVAVLRDMTEERHIDDMKQGFVANVSHELRTPVAMMQGYSEAIIDDIAQTDQEKKDMAQIILDESKRMGRLVNELLDLAKLEAGHFQLDKKDVPLAAFFRHTVNKFASLAREMDVRLTIDTDVDQEARFELDPDRIEQVMTNLIDNAIRHTKKGGRVAVTVRTESGNVLVTVRDTGTGIAKKDLPFVFERFYKEDKARTRGKAGTGLGLAIAKHIVQAHNGEIGVHSKKGEGTTFWFMLPNRPETDNAAAH